MNPWYVLAIVLFVTWTAAMAYWLWPRGQGEWLDAPTVEVPVPAALAAPAPAPAAPEPRALGEVLVPAPRIGDMTLRDWLVHRHPREYREERYAVWAEVVAEFYTAAADDPEIAAYFEHTDMQRLQRHFLSALLILTHTGLTVGALDAMRTKHSGLNITAPVFDRTVLALAGVMESRGVPNAAIGQLLPAVDLLRVAIVMAPATAPRDELAGPRHRRRTA